MKHEYENYDDDLPPALAAQLEQLDRNHQLRSFKQERARRQKQRIRRKLDDWNENRRLRDELDYLS